MVCMFLYFSKITQKVVNGFLLNLILQNVNNGTRDRRLKFGGDLDHHLEPAK